MHGLRQLCAVILDANSGALLWEDQVDKTAALDVSYALGAHRGRVVAAGVVGADAGCDLVTGSGNCDFYVRALDAETGTLIWEDQFDEAGANDGALTLAMQGKQVFAAGWVRNAAGDLDLLVRAYDITTGAFLWEDQVDKAGVNDSAAEITAQGGQVFVAGAVGADASCMMSFGFGGNCQFYVRALNARTGALLWEHQVDKAEGTDFALAIAVQGGRVFAAGVAAADADCEFRITGNCDFYVQALDAQTGTLVWEDQVDKGGAQDTAFDLAVQGGQVFAVGVAEKAIGNADFLVRAYDTATGTLLWEDQFDKAGGYDLAVAVVVQGGQLFAAGYSTIFDFLVRAYDATTGALLWQDRFDQAGRGDGVAAVAVQGGQVFAAGFSENVAGNQGLLIRAYDAR